MRPLAILCIIATTFTSCIMEDDTERPSVSVIAPESGNVLFTDDGLRVLAEMTDNRGVLQYKLVLAGIDSLNDVAADSAYQTTFIDAANERSVFSLDEVIPLPAYTYNGHYRLVLTCVDVEGNESLADTVSFVIKNNADMQPPVFDLGGVEPNDTLGFAAGLSPSGNVTDELNLTFVTYYIGTTDRSDTVVYFEFPAIQNNTVAIGDIGWFFQVDSSWAQGSYQIYATGWDGYSGVSSYIPFHVKY